MNWLRFAWWSIKGFIRDILDAIITKRYMVGFYNTYTGPDGEYQKFVETKRFRRKKFAKMALADLVERDKKNPLDVIYAIREEF